MLDKFIIENYLYWEKCISVCTDGARSVSDPYGGLQALIRSEAPYVMWTHCIIIHREALAAQPMSSQLNLVLKRVVDVINYIKTRQLKARFFKRLCMNIKAGHKALLYYCSSRLLSRGNALFYVFELCQEIHSFLREEGHDNSRHYAKSDPLLKLTYLCVIFDKLHALNLFLQDNNITCTFWNFLRRLCCLGKAAVVDKKNQ
ncbi:hypothetical protein Trydic_g15311 [Trypoxylus dichotomus]